MPDKKEVTITRTEVITVASLEYNDYGDLIIIDKAGKTHKITSKRVGFFKDTLVVDRASELSFAMAYNKEYIYSAKLVSEALPPSVKVTTAPVPPKDEPTPKARLVGISTDEERRRSVSISYAKDLACHGKIGVEDMKRHANEFLKYMKGEIS